MRYVRNPSTDVYYNMAFDAFCLEELAPDEPVFCLWQNAPSVIIGRNQNALGEVNMPYLEAHGIRLARRVTGGGAVYHDLGNLNYTITGRSADLQRDYPRYPTLIIDALRSLGVEAALSGRNDIRVRGRKVSGYAKRVWKDRLMVHGTLMYDVDLDALTQALSVPGSKLQAAGIASVRSRVCNLRDVLPHIPDVRALAAALEDILSRHRADAEVPVTDAQRAAVQQRAQQRFASWDWVIGRSPQSAIVRKGRYACGTIEAHLTTAHGRIAALHFAGDFIGDRPAEALADALTGCPYERTAVLSTLHTLAVEETFDHLTPEELTTLLLL